MCCSSPFRFRLTSPARRMDRIGGRSCSSEVNRRFSLGGRSRAFQERWPKISGRKSLRQRLILPFALRLDGTAPDDVDDRSLCAHGGTRMEKGDDKVRVASPRAHSALPMPPAAAPSFPIAALCGWGGDLHRDQVRSGMTTQDRLPSDNPAWFTPERTRDRLHAGCRCAGLFVSRQLAQLRRRHVSADRQALCTHGVLPSWVGPNQNHFGPRRLKSRPSQRKCAGITCHHHPRSQHEPQPDPVLLRRGRIIGSRRVARYH